MIQLRNLHLQFGDQVVFNNINCTIQKQSQIGLVGRNGTGKSTLLKTIAQKIAADQGNIEIQKNATIAYMPQEVVIASKKSILNETLTSFDSLYVLYEKKNALESLLTSQSLNEEQMHAYAALQHQLQEEHFDEKIAKAKKFLLGLGFTQSKLQSPVSELSVGWKMRVVLAKLLLQDADFYLFDEPTNHLDLPAKNWFLNLLRKSSFGYLLVCHDRYFLDKACNTTFELSLGKLTIYHGNYTYYIKQKSINEEQFEKAYKKQQVEIKQKERTIDRFRSKSTKAKMAQSMIKQLDKIERIEIDFSPKTINISLPTPQRSGKTVLQVSNVAHSFTKQLFKNISFQVERYEKVALVAPNGTGKTTLFNLIAKKLSLQSGVISLGHNVTTALFDQDQDKVLNFHKTIFEEVSDNCPAASEQQIRSLLGAFLFTEDDIYKKCSVLSGGEKNRVAMTKVILQRANLLLLDEPTNHLDLESKEVICNALKDYEGTVLFVSHDQDFVNKLATKIVELNQDRATVYSGNYDVYLEQKNIKKELNKDLATSINTKQNNHKQNKSIFDLQKKCKNIENKITKLEEKNLSTLDKLGTTEYGTKLYNQLETTYKKIQEEIEAETKKWEELLITIDKEK